MGAWDVFIDMMAGLSPIAIFLRLLIAVTIGSVVGFDRRVRNNSAGIRTHALVCLGSALTMMLSQFIAVRFPGYRIDVSRIGAGVVGGIGFLGAGTIIMTDRNRVHGLSTAAGLWASSCIGLAIGMGFVEGTIAASILLFFILNILRRVDRSLYRHTKYLDLYIEFEDQGGVRIFNNMISEQNVAISDFQLFKGALKGDGPTALVSIELPTFDSRASFLKSLKNCEDIRYFQIT